MPGPPDPSRTGTSGAVSTLIMAADLSWEESAPPAPRLPLFDPSRPDIDVTALATGMGVPATRATSTAELAEQLSAAPAAPGPHLIEAILQPA